MERASTVRPATDPCAVFGEKPTGDLASGAFAMRNTTGINGKRITHDE